MKRIIPLILFIHLFTQAKVVFAVHKSNANICIIQIDTCIKNRQLLSTLQSEIKQLIDNCKVKEAKDKLNYIDDYYASCLSFSQTETQEGLLIDLKKRETNLRVLNNLISQFPSIISSNKCADAQVSIQQIREKNICNSQEIEGKIKEFELEIKKCLNQKELESKVEYVRKNLFNIERTHYLELKQIIVKSEEILKELKNIGYSPSVITAIENQLVKAKEWVEKQTQEHNKVEKKAENTQFQKIIKPEIYLAQSNFNLFISNGVTKIKVVNEIEKNYTAGVNVRFYKPENLLNANILVKYQNDKFRIYQDSLPSNIEKLNLSQLNLEFRGTLENKQSFHPIFSFGAGLNYPIKTTHTNYDGIETRSKLFQKNNFVNPNIYSIFSLGLGLEKKHIGITLEGFIKIHGVYLKNYLNSESFELNKYSSKEFSAIYFDSGIGLSFRFY